MKYIFSAIQVWLTLFAIAGLFLPENNLHSLANSTPTFDKNLLGNLPHAVTNFY